MNASTAMNAPGVESLAYQLAAELTAGSPALEHVALAVAGTALSLIHDAFLDKADGHSDESGLKWPDVTDYTLRRRKNPKYRRRSRREPHAILVDTEDLERSLAPAPAADAPSGDPGQVYRYGPGEVVVGTAVEYAGRHHRGAPEDRLPQRRLWPEHLPGRWLRKMALAAAGGLAAELAARLG